jgi:hypothetical protein
VEKNRVRLCTFKKVIEKVCVKYSIERNEIQMETALSRNRVGRKLKVKHRGTESPMAGIEGHLIKWFKHDGDKAMPKSKEGLLLRYRETHTRVVHGDRGAYLHEDITKAFAEATAGCQADAHMPPPTHVAPSVAAANTSIVAAAGAIAFDSATSTTTATGAIVVDSAPTVPTSDCQQNTTPSNAPPLYWGEVNPFDVGTHLNMEVPALPLCFASEDESCSDDNSVFLDLSRD